MIATTTSNSININPLLKKGISSGNVLTSRLISNNI
jgi:hypothetical protein